MSKSIKILDMSKNKRLCKWRVHDGVINNKYIYKNKNITTSRFMSGV